MRYKLIGLLSACTMIFLIIYRQIVLQAAADGIALCIQTVVPTLFPFLIFSSLLNDSLMGQQLRLLAPLARLLRIPSAGLPLLVTGFLGGYPTGATGIAHAIQTGRLHRQDGLRMMAFASNAGPAFIFGIGMTLFEDFRTCTLLWAIHMISALIVALLTPGAPITDNVDTTPQSISITKSLQRSVSVMAMICGWIVLFRVIICVAENWFVQMGNVQWSSWLLSTLEITNGICGLLLLQDYSMKMVAFSVLLGFGGFCVYLQTKSVCGNLGTGLYLPGKVTHAVVSGVLAYLVQLQLDQTPVYGKCLILILMCAMLCIIYHIFARKYMKMSSNFLPDRV